LASFPVAIVTFCAITWFDSPSSAHAFEKLGVGSVAPKLDVEHWVQNGGGKFKKVTSFETGKVYVVEFWATTCGPCVQSMPHLSELQTKYADQGLQIVSISSEPLDEVKAFLKNEIPLEDGSKVTIANVTKSYCLTTDPDGSSDKDYMLAAQQNGIPCAFIVGKDAKIEWIGHPMEMDEVVESVLGDTWDRAKYIAEQNLMEEMQKTIGGLVRKKKFSEAAAAIDGFLEKIDDKRIQFGLLKSKVELQIRANADTKEIKQSYVKLFSTCSEEPLFVQDVAWSAYENYTENKIESKEIIRLSIAAVEKVLDQVQGATKANLLDTVARLNHSIGNIQPAIDAQTQAVKLSDGSDEGSFKEFLEELQSEAKKKTK
jgi:thiol-disulfide isomerase/thioredoxin